MRIPRQLNWKFNAANIDMPKFSKSQRVFYWTGYVLFCITSTLYLYEQGAFENISFGGSVIILISYLAVAAVSYKYVKDNPDDFD